MTKKCSWNRLFLYIIIFFSLQAQFIYSEELDKWTVAAEKFVFVKGQPKNSITEGISETIPKSILENINLSLLREIPADEELERMRFNSRKERQSLYLQLSSQYQKRDALYLRYSGSQLDKKRAEEDKKIKDIEDKINNNIENLKAAELKEYERLNNISQDVFQEENKVSSFFKDVIGTNETDIITEEISLYNDDYDSLYIPSPEAKQQGYQSPLFNEEMHEKGIQSYLTGKISIYGNYISVSVDIYLYPGGRKIGSVIEIGNINDLEFVSLSIVKQVIPLLTNSMPVDIYFSIAPEEIKDSVKIYLDDVLQKLDGKKLIINSGVHTLQVMAEGYKSLSTSYFFYGNTKYSVEVNLEIKEEGNVFVKLKEPMLGDLYTNGMLAKSVDENESKIIINGKKVLGEFISEDGETAFFYIPEESYYNDNHVIINPKPVDRNINIEKRRRWMYGAYSAFMVSLIPSFIVKGTFLNQRDLYYNGNGDYNNANGWCIASNIVSGVSIGIGVFWVVELVRYLIAADSVLPEKAKDAGDLEIQFNNNEAETSPMEEFRTAEDKKGSVPDSDESEKS